MVGGMLRHMKSLRSMRRDNGWIHTLLEEAENERMHLLTFLQLRQPGFIFRGLVLLSQVLPLLLLMSLLFFIFLVVSLPLCLLLSLFIFFVVFCCFPSFFFCFLFLVLYTQFCLLVCSAALLGKDVFCMITLSLRFLCLFSEEPV